MYDYAVPSLLKTSLTIFTFVSFIMLFIILVIRPRNFIAMFTAGLGFFFINSILVNYMILGHNNALIGFLQKISNITASILIAGGCIKLLNKKIKKEIIMLFSLVVFLSIISIFSLIPVSYFLISYFAFLFIINLYVSIELIESDNNLANNRYLIGTVFLLMCLLDFFNYFFIKYEIYQVIYFTIISVVIFTVLIYTFLLFHKQNESKLYEKEVCFDDTFSNSGIGMTLISTECIFLHINAAFSEIVGYSEDELKNKSFKEITYSEDVDDDSINYSELLNGKRSFFQKEKRYVHKNGNIVYVILNVSLIRDKKGHPLYFIGQTQNITNYINLQNELKKGRERYEILLNSYDNAIAVIDMEYKCVLANKYVFSKIEETLEGKFEKDSVVGQKIKDIYPDFEKTDTYKAIEYVMINRTSKSITSNFINPKGESVWYQFRIFPYPEGVLVISANITEEFKKQQIINESELKYRSLVEQSLDGIMLIDKKGSIIEFNSEMESITGFNKNEVVNKTIWDIYHMVHYDRSRDKEMVQLLAESYNHSSQIKTFSWKRKNGETVYIQHFFYPINSGNNNILCCVCRDVTNLKKLEEMKEKAAQKEKLLMETIEMERLRTEFFSNLSHEFRTPLNVIVMSNKMLYDSLKSVSSLHAENLIKYLNASKINTYRLQRLINNLLDLTKIDSGYMKLTPQCCNIVEVVEELTQLAVKYANNKDITVTFDTDVEEKLIICDINMVDKIVLNLLSNAVKFTELGGSIDVTLSNTNEYTEIKIKDNGIGIPSDKLPHIFEGFRQADKSLTRGQEGVGIGLSIVKALVEMHNGAISISSNVDVGTTVTVKLPAGDTEYFNEAAITTEMFEDEAEKVNLEFSDIYF